MRKKIGGGLVLLAFTLLAACGGSEDQQTPSPTATDAETAYLEQVRTLEAELGAAFERIGEMLSRAYPVREVLFEAVARADLHSVFESVLRQAEEIAPPGRFRVDHERYVQMLRDSYPLALESERAIEDEDLLGLYISRARFAENRNTLPLETSLAFCTGTVPEDLLGIGRPSPCGRPGGPARRGLRCRTLRHHAALPAGVLCRVGRRRVTPVCRLGMLTVGTGVHRNRSTVDFHGLCGRPPLRRARPAGRVEFPVVQLPP